DGRPEPSRDHARRAAALSAARLPAARARAQAEEAARPGARVHAARAAGDAVAQRCARARRRPARPRDSVSAVLALARAPRSAHGRWVATGLRPLHPLALFLGRLAFARADRRRLELVALRGL